MEYTSFVQDLRKESSNFYRSSPDTGYAKEFEQQMQALVINFDIDDEERSQQQQCRPSSTPLASGSGLYKRINPSTNYTRLNSILLIPDDELNSGGARKKKKTIQSDQSFDGRESQCSNESSEGISMRYDSCSSNDDDQPWNQFLCDSPKESEVEVKTADNLKLHFADALLCETIDRDEDSLLEPTGDLTFLRASIEPSPVLSVSMKRTYDEANS
uniref:Uncharacterized protein n=1 Tax=Anopheles dirus TaxID=7168 RepID=A0A1Y9H262_9DIPT